MEIDYFKIKIYRRKKGNKQKTKKLRIKKEEAINNII